MRQRGGGAAAPATIVIAAAPGAVNLSAFGGHVVWSRRAAHTRRWELVQWHAGRVVRLPVASRAVPFDADAGPGLDGRPVVVFSRCTHDPGANDSWLAARGCRIVELALDRPGARPHAVPGTGGRGRSDTTPSSWHGRLALARRRTGERRQQVVLLDRTAAAAAAPARLTTPPASRVDSLDLGARVATFVTENHGDGIGDGGGWRLQVDRLDGRGSGSVSAGYVSGACGFRYPESPTADGLGVRWVEIGSPCERLETVFAHIDLVRHTGRVARVRAGLVLAAAADGPTTYWLRGGSALATDEDGPIDPSCKNALAHCRLLRSRTLPWRDVPDGEPLGPEPVD